MPAFDRRTAVVAFMLASAPGLTRAAEDVRSFVDTLTDAH